MLKQGGLFSQHPTLPALFYPVLLAFLNTRCESRRRPAPTVLLRGKSVTLASASISTFHQLDFAVIAFLVAS